MMHIIRASLILAVAVRVGNAQKVDAVAWQLQVAATATETTIPYQYGIMFEVWICINTRRLHADQRNSGHQPLW